MEVRGWTGATEMEESVKLTATHLPNEILDEMVDGEQARVVQRQIGAQRGQCLQHRCFLWQQHAICIARHRFRGQRSECGGRGVGGGRRKQNPLIIHAAQIVRIRVRLYAIATEWIIVLGRRCCWSGHSLCLDDYFCPLFVCVAQITFCFLFGLASATKHLCHHGESIDGYLSTSLCVWPLCRRFSRLFCFSCARPLEINVSSIPHYFAFRSLNCSRILDWESKKTLLTQPDQSIPVGLISIQLDISIGSISIGSPSMNWNRLHFERVQLMPGNRMLGSLGLVSSKHCSWGLTMSGACICIAIDWSVQKYCFYTFVMMCISKVRSLRFVRQFCSVFRVKVKWAWPHFSVIEINVTRKGLFAMQLEWLMENFQESCSSYRPAWHLSCRQAEPE